MCLHFLMLGFKLRALSTGSKYSAVAGLHPWHCINPSDGPFALRERPPLLSIAMIKRHDQKHSGKERGYFSLQLPVYHEGKIGQKHGSRS